MLIRPPLVLDADLISCFAWVKRFDILESLYSGLMRVLPEVINEVNRIPHLGSILHHSISNRLCRNIRGFRRCLKHIY